MIGLRPQQLSQLGLQLRMELGTRLVPPGNRFIRFDEGVGRDDEAGSAGSATFQQFGALSVFWLEKGKLKNKIALDVDDQAATS